MNLNPLEARQIELLFLLYIHAGGIGDSTYSINLKDICTVDDGYALWFIAAEDLMHEGWIVLTGKQLEDAVASITPAGRKQAREWERQYDLNQRLVSVRPDGEGIEGQSNKARYWVNFMPIQLDPAMSSGGEVTLDELKAGYVLYDGTEEDALHYITSRTGGTHYIYVSNVKERKRGADIYLSSERQRAGNQQLDTGESKRDLPGKWPVSSLKVIFGVGSIHISRLNNHKSQVSFVAYTEDCTRFVDSLIERMRNEGVIVLPPPAEGDVTKESSPAAAMAINKSQIADWPENFHLITNGLDMERRGLSEHDYYLQMQHEGKVIENYEALHTVGAPTTLIGFTEEEIDDAWSSLSFEHYIEAIDTVLSHSGIPYEYAPSAVVHKFWLENGSGKRCCNFHVTNKTTGKAFGAGFIGVKLSDSEYEAWREVLRELRNRIGGQLLEIATDIIQHQQTYPPFEEEEPPNLSKPHKPQKPVSNSGLAIWFDYYHACKKRGIRYTLKELAFDTHRAHGAIRQKHREYKAERGISSG